jgi:sugar lactone lactonase YvrE
VTVECVLDVHAELGECPVWSGRDQCLFWVDVEGRVIHRYDPSTGVDQTCELAIRPGSFALTADPDRLVVAAEHQFVEVAWSTGEVKVLTDLEPAGRATRLNDGRCDPAGRFWVGSTDDPTWSRNDAGMLHRIEPDGSATVVRTGVGVSNGLAFSPDGSVMYHADTNRDRVWAYDYDLDRGEPSNERVFLDFTDLPGRPDGACIDEDGCYWIACVKGWAILRATPEGKIDRIIDLPVEKPTMPAFGGPGLDTIFVTSISIPGSTPMAPGQPQAGGLFAVSAGVKGLPEPRFGG